MKVITCPDKIESNDLTLSVFLGGGISNCADWQNDLIAKLKIFSVRNKHIHFNVFNPRRDTFDVSNKDDSKFQITWEYRYLHKADINLFWFPPETLCPITLYELGAAAHYSNCLLVGCDPNYQRKFDVEIQLSLIRPEVRVVDSLENLMSQLIFELGRRGYHESS